MQAAQVLASLFVSVNFHWDSQRLSQLELVRTRCLASISCVGFLSEQSYLVQVLNNFESFPTKTDICVFSDDRTGLANVMASWQFSHVELCGYPNEDDTDPFAVVWEHRHTVESALKSGAPAVRLMIVACGSITQIGLILQACIQLSSTLRPTSN